jgi:hypothetical protein
MFTAIRQVLPCRQAVKPPDGNGGDIFRFGQPQIDANFAPPVLVGLNVAKIGNAPARLAEVKAYILFQPGVCPGRA